MRLVRHYKGGVYAVIAEGQVEATLEPVTIYRGIDGRVWVRPTVEFKEKFTDIENLMDG